LILLILDIQFIQAGCLGNFSNTKVDTKVELYSEVDPAFTKTNMEQIIVWANIADRTTQKALENVWVNEFKIYNENAKVYAISGIIPMTRKVENEIDSIIYEYNIDAIIVLNVESQEKKYYYVPETQMKTGKGEWGYLGNYSYKERTEKYGGYYFTKPLSKINIEIYETNTSRLMYLAQVKAAGNAYASPYDLVETTVKEATKDIFLKGLMEFHKIEYEYKQKQLEEKEKTKTNNAMNCRLWIGGTSCLLFSVVTLLRIISF